MPASLPLYSLNTIGITSSQTGWGPRVGRSHRAKPHYSIHCHQDDSIHDDDGKKCSLFLSELLHLHFCIRTILISRNEGNNEINETDPKKETKVSTTRIRIAASPLPTISSTAAGSVVIVKFARRGLYSGCRWLCSDCNYEAEPHPGWSLLSASIPPRSSCVPLCLICISCKRSHYHLFISFRFIHSIH